MVLVEKCSKKKKKKNQEKETDKKLQWGEGREKQLNLCDKKRREIKGQIKSKAWNR